MSGIRPLILGQQRRLQKSRAEVRCISCKHSLLRYLKVGAMAAQVRIWFKSLPIPKLNSSFPDTKLHPPRTLPLTVEMVSQPGPNKRSVCPNCRKPSRICLCTRLKTPILQNSVAVTILQHKLEQNHPLNSTRIATLGLKNVTVVSVSDVYLEARFVIHPLEPDLQTGSTHSSDKLNDVCEIGASTLHGSEENVDNVGFSDSPGEKNVIFEQYDGNFGTKINDIFFTIEKYGSLKSLFSNLISDKQCQKKEAFDWLMDSASAVESLRKSFSVKKFHRELSYANAEFEESDEFEINVPHGSVLLFPSEEAVAIEDINFEVKNLIVLDGTWAKAKRMYKENPWLRFLPHLKLDLDEVSLYGEVRQQPKSGCLSTIESIVYAMKAFGEDSEKLDGLLDVFDSMIGDQKRCKKERLTGISAKSLDS